MDSNIKKKAQISIYILVGIIILILLFFLINSNSQAQKDELEEAIAQTNPQTEELMIVKTRVDNCLTKQLQKALIVAGLRGGYIYDKGEYSFGGIIPENTYSYQFISNLGLNWNNLQSKVIVHSNIVPAPIEMLNNTLKLNGEYFYTHTTAEDFDKFINSEFLKCLDFSDLENKYEVNYSDYYGDVQQINYKKQQITITNIDGKLNDQIILDLEAQDITGIITQVLEPHTFLVDMTNLNNLQEEDITTIENLKVINLENKLNMDIDFDYEYVSIQSHFPITIKNQDLTSTFKETTIRLPVRFKALLEFAKEMLNTKYYDDKSIDYSNPEDIKKALNSSKYFRESGSSKFTVNKKLIKNDNEHKQYVYSIIDYDSKINGNPYVFNFGYENIAPKVNFKTINSNFNVYENSTTIITLIATAGDEITYELRPHTKDEQLYDNYFFYFLEQNYDGLDAQFHLNSNGTLTFKPFKEKLYSYPIKVTDGETIREHQIVFITGFPDNTNNTAATKCIEFKNYEDKDGLFPIANQFKNKVYEYKTGEYENVFGLVPYYGNKISYPNRAYDSEIWFSKSCVYDPNLYTIKVYDKNGNIVTNVNKDGSEQYYKIPVDTDEISSQEFKIEIRSQDENTIMTEPFYITLYPASCLGPDEDETSFSATCCNTQAIQNKVDSAIANSQPSNLALIGSSILNNEDIIFNDYIYACYGISDETISDNLFNTEENILWDDVNNKITSLFETRMLVQCQGEYPRPENNIKSLTGGNMNFGNLVGIKLGDTIIDNTNSNSVSANFKLVKQANKCEFCDIETKNIFSLITSYGSHNLIFKTGIKENNSGTISTLPSSSSYLSYKIKCDNNWYGSDATNPLTNSDWSLITSNFGAGGDPSAIHISQGYCALGSTQCTGKKNTETSQSNYDSQTSCSDYYFNYNNKAIVSSYNGNWDGCS